MRWWEMLTQRFRAPRLMERMMRRFGVAGQFSEWIEGGRELRSAAIRCMSCGEAKACEGWLDTQSTADAPPAYCRNAELIHRLRQAEPTLH